MFENIIETLTVLTLPLIVCRSYLEVNKIWPRKHIIDVAESISLSGMFISIILVTPFLLKFLFVTPDLVTATGMFIGVIVTFIQILIGSKLWVYNNRDNFLTALRKGFIGERAELSNILDSFKLSNEQSQIVSLLIEIAALDKKIDKQEKDLIENIALKWGIDMPENWELEVMNKKPSLLTITQNVKLLIKKNPTKTKSEFVLDLIHSVVHIDNKVTLEEKILIDEIFPIIEQYSSNVSINYRYIVLVIPHIQDTQNIMEDCIGVFTTVDRYITYEFAHIVKEYYKNQGFFSVIVDERIQHSVEFN